MPLPSPDTDSRAQVGRRAHPAGRPRRGHSDSQPQPGARRSAPLRLAHMAEGLWWLPSLIVFAAAALALVGTGAGLRRLGARRERAALEQGRAAETRAKGLIVQADNAVREAEREVAFAEAQFGAAVAREVRTAVETGRARLREAFLLQQRLDDAEPDTPAERRRWTARIEDLCRLALTSIGEAEAVLASRRNAERGVNEGVPALREYAARLGRRRDEARNVLERLGSRFGPSALAAANGAAFRVDSALAGAETALAEAERRLGRSEPAAELLAVAADRLEHAQRDLAEIEGFELALAAAQSDAAAAAAALDAELIDARGERDRLADAEAAAALGAAVGQGSAVMAGRSEVAGDPFADRGRLRAARDRLEVARAAARAAQGRLDGAREALGGAIAIAESQLRVAEAAIADAGGTVGAAARARLAEAERQLLISRQEPDPVAALDAARRAAARASDAEALARYDAPRPLRAAISCWDGRRLHRAPPERPLLAVEVPGALRSGGRRGEPDRRRRRHRDLGRRARDGCSAPVPRDFLDALPAQCAVVASGLVDAPAVAAWILAEQERLGRRAYIAIVAAGESRGAFDAAGVLAAGALIDALTELGIDDTAPEAAVACAAFVGLRRAVGHLVTASGAGRAAAFAGASADAVRAAGRLGSSNEVRVVRASSRA